MSKSAKPEERSFEESLSRLTAIVESMEAEDLPLEQLLARYEEGAKLAKSCQDRLSEAELKVQQLEKALAGEWTLKSAAGESVD